MKENTKKILLVIGLMVAINCIIAVKMHKARQSAAELPDDAIVGKGKPALLELGSHGCKPCEAMFPILIELSKEQTDFAVAFVDVKADTKKSEQYNIELIPVQIFFDAEGKELYRHVGFYPKEDILNKWNELGT
jgi:thioredoxin 1